MKTSVVFLVACLLVSAPVLAQDSTLPEAEQSAWDVYIKNHEDDATTELLFINILTGDVNSVSTAGERFTLLGDAVIYYDRGEEQVKRAKPDTLVEDHPFVTRSAAAFRVDWVVSSDRQRIAWTETSRVDADVLLSSTFVSGWDGSNRREILIDGPREGVRVLPVAFSADASELIMEAHPDGISHHFPYVKYAGLFALNLVDGAVRELPDEAPCYCAAGFGEHIHLRFPLSSRGNGVEVLVYDLEGSQQMVIESAAPAGFTTPGEALVSPDDKLALYVVSQFSVGGESKRETRSVIMLADLQSFEQSPVSNPITGLVRTLSWTEDHSAVLFASDQQLGTWKLRFSDGKITKVARAIYLGSLRG